MKIVEEDLSIPVAALSHPLMSVRDVVFLELLKRILPTGRGKINNQELGDQLRQSRKTIGYWMRNLEEVGAIEVVDGGRGSWSTREIQILGFPEA